MRLLVETKGQTWVNKASAWPIVERRDPTFYTKDHGETGFAEMLKTLDTIIETKKGEKNDLARLR